MSNLTPLFRKYVEVIGEAREGDVLVVSEVEVKKRKQWRTKFTVSDTFLEECSDLLKHIIELRKVILSLQVEYLGEVDMSEQEKNDFDVEVRLQLQEYLEKLKHMEKYELERQKVVNTKFISGTRLDLVGMLSGRSQEVADFHSTNNQYRTGVLQSLGMWLTSTSSLLSQMQRERLSRQKELESIDFNAHLYVPTNSVGTVAQSPTIETTQDEIKQYKETMSKLTQEQIQVLETEHEELLNQKSQELERVQKLSKAVMEVASLQNELSTHLQIQTQNINTLLDNNDDVELDIQQGNRQLRKAQDRGGKSAKLVIYMAIIFGLLILFLDYIN
ncbi:Ufe1p Ecym_4041 [Eremothecium cymbalariae DBVPG|uniref:t-SNARE coiled-coil homology domain-containing protein n=1 Tax=Eremothecium cymbalariae (strain CBS 270.75 / DBVPG 7215 / KCTC 17166 / NRRL Y-17582) TaxID=931890 RepID=G8JSW9_ERECY|nr:hypothetical protein Ecym_4041 [Eremothecium cymbalariae DBVPG\